MKLVFDTEAFDKLSVTERRKARKLLARLVKLAAKASQIPPAH